MPRLITMNFLLGSALVICGCTAPTGTPNVRSAMAGDPAGAAAVGANGVKLAANGQEKVCRREVATGSVMSKSVCRTREEWARLAGKAQADRERLDQMQRAKDAVTNTRRGY